MTNGAERTVISLGGSIFVPDEIDTSFLRGFMDIIKERIAAGERFAIILGGGKTCRRYQAAARELSNASITDQDWIGIASIKLNAEFMRITFKDVAYERVIEDPHEVVETDRPVIFCGALEPGWSSDYDAVMRAKTIGAKKVLNLSNTNYVYDKDPRTNPDAKPFKEITWDDYRKLIPSEWVESGMSTPFDPIASKEAHALGLRVDVINGTKLEEVRKCLQGEAFDGTVIR